MTKFKLFSGLTLSLVALILTSASPVAAQTVTPAGAGLTARLATLHTRCDTEVSTRIATLSSISTRLAGIKKLSDTQKAQFQNQIQTASSGLTTLKAKCDADTDLATLRTDVKDVFTVYRIYAVQEPQIRLLAAADTLSTTADQMTDLVNLLTTRVQQAGNPSTLTNFLSDMTGKIADAKAQAATVMNAVSALTPDSYNTDPSSVKTVLTNTRADIKAGSIDLKASWTDARSLRTDLKGLKVTTTPTPTP